jgi:hypothetical protein
MLYSVLFVELVEDVDPRVEDKAALKHRVFFTSSSISGCRNNG